nr:multidrug resistance-associated protein 3 [Tanacetum cinerariifolium]
MPRIVLAQVIFQVFQIGSNYWMAWASPVSASDPTRVEGSTLIIVYVALAAGNALCILARVAAFLIFLISIPEGTIDPSLIINGRHRVKLIYAIFRVKLIYATCVRGLTFTFSGGKKSRIVERTALLQTAVVEPLPPKDDKGSQNRTKGLKYAISTKEDATSFSIKNCFIASFSMESDFSFDMNLQKLVSRPPSTQNLQKLE